MLSQWYFVIRPLFAEAIDLLSCATITTIILSPADCLLQFPFVGPRYSVPPSTTRLPVTATAPSYSAVSVYLDMSQRTPVVSHSVECSPWYVHSNKLWREPQCHRLNLFFGGWKAVIGAGIYAVIVYTDLCRSRERRRSNATCTVRSNSDVPKSFVRRPASQIINGSRLKKKRKKAYSNYQRLRKSPVSCPSVIILNVILQLVNKINSA